MQQVLYSSATGIILQWQDALAFSYAPVPPGVSVLSVTAAQWAEQGTPQYVVNPGTSTAALAAGTAPAPVLTLAQQAAKLLAGGIVITSTGSAAALNGTYSTGPAATQNAGSIASFVNINGKFPGTSTTTLTYADSAGNPHVFPSTTEFLAFFTAAGNFVADCQDVIYGLSETLPENTATIP